MSRSYIPKNTGITKEYAIQLNCRLPLDLRDLKGKYL